jgi:F0F1-type ATP synthase assembly protein I
VFLAIAIFLFLYKMRKKHKDQLGFLFIAGSALKFAVFFLVFHPDFMLDGDINKLEFASFFIPYLLCLIIETLSLVKWLNKSD